jgi:serine protease Do
LERTKTFILGHFTTALSVLVVLNVLVILFILMGVGWQQISDVPVRLLEKLKDPPKVQGAVGLAAGALTVGTVSDPNLQMVCSDETFAAAVAKVRPAVVNITCDSIQTSPQVPGYMRFDDPARDLATLGGIGSGFVVHSKGFVLTCLHVVARASNIYVTPFGPEAQRYRAHVVAQDEALNLAMLKISVPYELPAATTGESAKMEVADVVLAIGSPFGLEQSVTHGIISDNSRDLVIDGRLYREMVQTDVAINRGSSGGPLINVNGEVIGINMAIYSTTGVYHGISFALPIDRAKTFLARAIPAGA